MARMYTNQKTHLSVVSGKITAIGEDRKSLTVETQVFNRDESVRAYEKTSIAFTTQVPIEEDAKVGDNVTVAGFEQVDMINETSQWVAGYVSTKNDSFQYKTLAVVNGEVTFARYVDEIGEDGKPNMTKERMGADGSVVAPKAKSPHFDIGVATQEQDGEGGTKRVLHIVKAYPDPVKDAQGNIDPTKKNFDKIEALKKRFANFDKETNPMRVTIATQPGTVSSNVREYNGNTYENNYNNHMGVYSLDIEYLKERTRGQEAPAATTAAPAQEEQTPAAPTTEQTEAPAPAPAPTAAPPAEDDIESYFSIN